MNIGRIKLAAAALDGERRVTSSAIQYANQREQFNSKIIEFGAVKEMLVKNISISKMIFFTCPINF